VWLTVLPACAVCGVTWCWAVGCAKERACGIVVLGAELTTLGVACAAATRGAAAVWFSTRGTPADAIDCADDVTTRGLAPRADVPWPLAPFVSWAFSCSIRLWLSCCVRWPPPVWAAAILVCGIF